jgi:hypothetical protein
MNFRILPLFQLNYEVSHYFHKFIDCVSIVHGLNVFRFGMFQICFNLMECVSILQSQHRMVFQKMRIEVFHLVEWMDIYYCVSIFE